MWLDAELEILCLQISMAREVLVRSVHTIVVVLTAHWQNLREKMREFELVHCKSMVDSGDLRVIVAIGGGMCFSAGTICMVSGGLKVWLRIGCVGFRNRKACEDAHQGNTVQDCSTKDTKIRTKFKGIYQTTFDQMQKKKKDV